MSSILIVEDDEDAREALAIFLRRKGYEVHSAPNGMDGLAAIVKLKPDLVVLDIFLPEVDGPSLLSAARSYLLPSLPVVVLTALPESGLTKRVREMGVGAVLTKGTASLEDVHRAIEESLPPTLRCSGHLSATGDTLDYGTGPAPV
jgi:DNA-binding response OmpR family regulator